MMIVHNGTSNCILVAHKSLSCGHLSIVDVYLMHSLPFLKSLAFVTQQSFYTIYKNYWFFVLASWDLNPLPIDSTNFNIYDLHYFRAYQMFHYSHLWNRGSWYCHMWVNTTLISACHTFDILIELPCFFKFQTVSCCFISGKNSINKAQMNSTTNRSDSVKISEWKVTLIYFSKHWWNFIARVCHVISVINRSNVHQLFIKDGTKLTFIQGIPYLYTTHKHLITNYIPSNLWVQ